VSEVVGWVAVGLLAMLGAVARFTIDVALQRRIRSPFPFGTLAINTTGSLALGVLAGAGVSGWSLRLAGAALIGSFTTFSTWIADSTRLAGEGDLRRAALNLVGSMSLGLSAVALGWALGSAI
jgi:CrcB protein